VETIPNPTQNPINHLIKNQPTNTKKGFYTKTKPYYKKTNIKPTKHSQSKSKPKFDLKNITCYKYGKKGHPFRFCWVNTSIKRRSHPSYPNPFDWNH
jgi:hypothetical protein